MDGLVSDFHINPNSLTHLTSAVQFGFVAGTLAFALLAIADRHSPSGVFFFSSVLGALFNLALIVNSNSLFTLLSLRFLTGFFLAGVYPVGMKIAADYYQKGLGRSLGLLVGALVVGTALPHLFRSISSDIPWRTTLIMTSSLALVGGILIKWLVPDGPYRKRLTARARHPVGQIFKLREFRSAALGYFGHMWELYAFWAFVPLMLETYASQHPEYKVNISRMSFAVIAAGGPACILGGFVSETLGAKKTATCALLLSGLCCLLSPLFIYYAQAPVWTIFLIFWGMVVVADSPMFSTLVATHVPAESKGTSLTLVNCIGFSITIISIQLLGMLLQKINPVLIYTLLAAGPLFGLIALREKSR
jgi:MFS family permease